MQCMHKAKVIITLVCLQLKKEEIHLAVCVCVSVCMCQKFPKDHAGPQASLQPLS